MRLLAFLLICWIGTNQISSFAQSNFRVIAETQQALVGSSFRVEFRLENEEGKQFAPPDFGGLQVVSGPSRSMQTSIINGRTSFSVGYIYILAATKAGKYKIGPASIIVGSQIKKTSPLTIEIVGQQTQTKQFKEFFIRAELSDQKVYIGQQLTLKYRIFSRVGIDNIDVVSSPKLDAFYKEFIATGDGQPQRMIENGVEYQTKILGIQALYPMKSGKYKIDASTFRVILSNEDSWGFSLKSMFSQRAEVIQTNECVVEVKDFPKPIPEGFSGATGFFVTQLDQPEKKYSMSDAIQINMTITGTGHFQSIGHQLHIPDSLFQLAEGKTTEPVRIKDDTFIVNQVKSTYLLTPKKPGKFELFPEFIFLDPESGKYVTQRDTIQLEIAEGGIVKNMDNEIPPLVEDFKLSKFENDLFRNPWTYVLLIFPFILTGFLYSIPKIKSKLSKASESRKSLNVEVDVFSAVTAEKKLIHYFHKKYPQTVQHISLYALKMHLQTAQLLSTEDSSLIREFELLKFQPDVREEQWRGFMGRLG